MSSEHTDFEGLRVGAFESRRADEMSKLISKFKGQPFVSPSMREVPLENDLEAVEFANRLLTGEIDVVIFLTGVGFRYLVSAVERQMDRRRFLESLSDIVTIARGPKVTAAMREVGLTPSQDSPEPNTWREVIETIDQHYSMSNQTVALQEYGKPNSSLVAGLEARGARVVCVPIYRWELPEKSQLLAENVRRIIAGELDVLLFTSAHQVVNLYEMARQLGQEAEFRKGISRIVIASIGPTTSETLREFELPVDLQPTHSRMGHLVRELAQSANELVARKRKILVELASPTADVLDTRAPWYNSPFMRACRQEPCDVTPVWLMRQAGRYMQEYREVRSKMTFLELCKNPSLCSEVMCTAVNRLGVDAAIIFSDLLPILEPMGLDLEFAKGEGPVIHNPVREGGDVDRVLELESVDALHFVMETVRLTRADLPADLPLIGFSGAPFTLASYMIEGGSSRTYLNTKTLMYRDHGAWKALMGRLSRAITKYLNAQIAAGAQCVQLFDSWVGSLSTRDYKAYVFPFVKDIISHLTPGVPVINFATGNPALLPLLTAAGGDVIGIDWRISLDEAWKTVGFHKAVQGNLEPLVLLADRQTIRERAKEVLDQAKGRPGHIFNLGHGVVQQTPVDNAIALVDAVHELSQR